MGRRFRGAPTAGLAAIALLCAVTSGAAIAGPERASLRMLVHTDGPAPSAPLLASEVPALDVVRVRPLAGDLAVVTVRTSAGPAAAERALEAAPDVLDASPDRRTGLTGARAPIRPSDSFFRHQWDLWDSASTARAGGYGVDAPRAWTRTLGSPQVVVAVLDTGITRHPDLAGAAIAPGYDFVSPVDGVDPRDGDDWDPDPSDPGDACAAAGEGSSWHGTFVAGELIAQHGNGGVVGIAPAVTVEPVRVLGGCGGSEADTVAAIEWASGGTVPGVPVNTRPAAVISMSLGASGGACPAAMQTAVDDAIGRGSVLVAAAGNDGTSVAGTSPADCAGVVSVVASTRSGGLASYSNRGTVALRPTLAAPGGSDRAPVLGDGWTSDGAATAAGNRPTVVGAAGTSMAAPRVTGAVALLLSVDRGLSPAEVVRRLTASATAFPGGSSCTPVRCGAGLVNAGDLLGTRHRFVLANAVRATGSAAPGHRLTASAAGWHPLPVRVRYRWLRDGHPIARATGRHFRVRSTDRGHRIAVRITAVRARTVALTATSRARSVPR